MNDTDANVERILRTYATITVVGASAKPGQTRPQRAGPHAGPRMAHHPDQSARRPNSR